MKGKDRAKTIVWMLTVVFVFGTLLGAAESRRNPSILLQEAIYHEETEGDLDKAIELYGQVLEQAADVERLAARATYQLGLCHLKKGNTAKAIEYFEEVVGYYPNQTSAVKNAQKQLDKLSPAALKPSNMLPREIMGYIIDKHFQTGKKANELGIRSNTIINGVDGMKKYSGGLLDVFNMGNDMWTEKRKIGTFTPNNKDLMLYNEEYQEQVFEWEDVVYPRGQRCNLIWTPDRPVVPGQFRILGYVYNKTSELLKTGDGYEITMQNHYGSEVLENFFLILPSSIKIVNMSHDITSHKKIQDLDIYQFERHMKGENNIVTVTIDFVDLTTPNSPIVVETSPVNLSNNVSPEITGITVTFDKEMFPGGYSWCRNQHPFPEGRGESVFFSNGNFSCTLPVKLKPDQYYRIGINTPPYNGFKSVDGDMAHEYVLVFATADENGQPTQIPPSLIEEVNAANYKATTPEELQKIVEKAVLTISTCAETDPRVKESLESLKGIQEESLITELSTYLDSETPTIRRSAIYILWKGGFSDISAAQEKLVQLCHHEENYTRGMAALALAGNKMISTYDTLVDMTLNDKDPYARRCGAYALGLLGDPKALPTLEQAQNDPEDMVKQNAQAAITMLTKLNNEQSDAPEPKPTLIQEGRDDIQPDGTIIFRSPNYVVNNGTEPITEQHFINSDFVHLTSMTDEQGKPVEFTATHEGNIYRYHVILDPPVMPGETYLYYTEGTIIGLIKPVAGKENTYRYFMNHSPNTGQPVLRIEEYLLPEGAEVVSILDDDMKQSEQDGRILLHVKKVIPAGGSILTSFQYRILDTIQLWVEDFFKHNYRDITHLKTLEWGEPTMDENGNTSIRYKYEATIWDKDKIIENKVWTFDEQGKFISVRRVGAEDIYSLAGVQSLVEDFFANNYRDITKRKTIEWDQPIKYENGDVSIRYKYEATIWDKDTIIQDKIWTFDKNGKFVSVNDASPSNLTKAKDTLTPEETIIGFMQTAVEFDIDKAMSYVADDSHDYDDIKAIFENSEHPFYQLFKKADASVPIKVTRADISDTMCSAVWEITLKEDFSFGSELNLKAGDTFEIDGNLHKYGDQWLITGI